MNQEEHLDELALARAAANALRQSESVDRRTAERLAASRKRALALAGRPSVTRRLLVPASAFAVAALAVVLLRPQQQAVQAPAPAIADAHGIDTLDLLTDDASPAFYRDLEFYQWLEKEQPHA